MSKLSKLLKTPDIFIKDAVKKRITRPKNTIPSKKEIKISKKKPDEIKVNLAVITNKVNLVIIDDIENDHPFKLKIIKYQFRSLDKYTKFSTISYISENINSTPSHIDLYKTYKDFYAEKVLLNAPKVENFIFININFLFLREVNNYDFLNNFGIPYTFYLSDKKISNRIKNIVKEYLPSAVINFRPAFNYSCTTSINLIHFNDVIKKTINLSEYVFDFLPVINCIFSGEQNLVKTPLQFAYLNHGYMEKFIWIQSVHGSNKCPIAINFNGITNDCYDYTLFLNSIVPHISIHESSFMLSHETNHQLVS